MSWKKVSAALAAAAVCALAWATVESVTYISDLNQSYPASGDVVSEGRLHIINIKKALQNTFPNITGAVTPTQTELNYVGGVTSAIQTQINTKAASTSVGLVLLSSQSPSGASTVDFTSSIDSTYEEYEIRVQNLTPSAGAALWVRVSTDAGATWVSGGASYRWATVDSGTLSAPANAAQIVVSGANVSSAAADAGWSGTIRIVNPAGTTADKQVISAGTYGSATAGLNPTIVQGSGIYQATTAVNGIRLLASTGTLTGKVKLYGVRKS